MLIKLKKPYVAKPAEKAVELSEIVIERIVDHYIDRKVIAFLKNATVRNTNRIVLWEDEAYDAIGQWTDTMASKRIVEILTN